MHGQWGIGQMPAATNRGLFEGSESHRGLLGSRGSVELSLRLLSLLRVRRRSTITDSTGLERTAIETGTIVIVTLANDFTATDNDTTVTIVKGRLRGLLETHGKV